ncbi:MAG: DUF6362 family protein [Pseudomonadota bacterium]
MTDLLREIAVKEANAIDPKEGCAACLKLIQRAILTLKAVPDPDRRYQGLRKAATFRDMDPERIVTLKELLDGFGPETPRVNRFRPSPRDVEIYLDVLKWLTWLQSEDRRGSDLIVARTFGVPYWKLATRHGRSEDTVRRWHDGAIATLFKRFADEVVYLKA